MKRYTLALMVPLLAAGSAMAGPIQDTISASGGISMFWEDNSRELLVDVDQDGQLSPGDVLVGYLKIDATSPPSVNRDNDIYAVFSQTFDPATFASQSLGPGVTRYAGTFMPTPDSSPYSLENLLANNAPPGGFDDGAIIAMLDKPGGFSKDLIVDDLPSLGNVDGAITSILDAEGTVRFTIGFGDAGGDFFAFETIPLGPNTTTPDYVQDPTQTANIPTSQPLGNFGAGLSILDNYLSVEFFRDQTTSFFQNTTLTNFGVGHSYDVAILNGNYGGIMDSSGGLLQGGGLSFVNNADATLHAVPEPAGVALLGAGLALLGFRRARARD